MDSHQQRKHRRIMAIARVIERRGRVNYKHFLAEMQYHGLRRRVAEEYIEVLKDLDKVKFDKGDIVWNGKNESNERKSNNQKQEGEKQWKDKERERKEEEIRELEEKLERIKKGELDE